MVARDGIELPTRGFSVQEAKTDYVAEIIRKTYGTVSNISARYGHLRS
jgi:hypothetical protein